MDVQPYIRDKYQPHWLWAACFLVAPFVLTASAFMGIWAQPVIPLRLAIYGPRVAVLISIGGIAAALFRRRRLATGIAMLGLAISFGGYLVLLWLQGP